MKKDPEDAQPYIAVMKVQKSIYSTQEVPVLLITDQHGKVMRLQEPEDEWMKLFGPKQVKVFVYVAVDRFGQMTPMRKARAQGW